METPLTSKCQHARPRIASGMLRWAVLLAVGPIGLLGGSYAAGDSLPALRRELPSVRVLLFEQAGAVRIAGRSVAPVAGGLRVSGIGVRPFWRVPAASSGAPRAVKQLRVRGDIEVVRTERGIAVVNEVPLESYLAGTLGQEMPASWDEQALRAQAVVSRTYALYQREARRGELFDLYADSQSQVYGGVDAESEEVRGALAATRGEILTYGDAPILAAFHATSGGATASSEEVWGGHLDYLVSVPVEGEDDSPDTYWRAVISRPTLRRAVASLGHSLGAVRSLRVVERSRSGRVLKVRVRAEDGRVDLGGRELREALGKDVLRSTVFDVRLEQEGFVFFGSGRGHGVGMSQWGARAMAKRGASYRQILETFFPGAQLALASATPSVAAGPDPVVRGDR